MTEPTCMRCRVEGGHGRWCDHAQWTMQVVRDRARDGLEPMRRKAAVLDARR